MHQSYVKSTYKHIMLNYGSCDFKITIFHTLISEETDQKLHTRIGLCTGSWGKVINSCLKLKLYKNLASIEQVQHIKVLIHHQNAT